MVDIESDVPIPGDYKESEADIIPSLIESDRSPIACRKSWARLIQKIYEGDPLVFPKCRGPIRIISFIEYEEVIKAILNHLGLRLVRGQFRGHNTYFY